MEKYGVDMEQMPPTDDQLRLLKGYLGDASKLPSSFKEAAEMLSECEKSGSEEC